MITQPARTTREAVFTLADRLARLVGDTSATIAREYAASLPTEPGPLPQAAGHTPRPPGGVMRATRTTAALAALTVIGLAQPASAAPSDSDGHVWRVTDLTGSIQAQTLRQRPATARSVSQAARRPARPSERHTATRRIAGHAMYPWRASSTCAATTRTPAGVIIWTVRRGDSLWHIATCTGTTVQTLRAMNPLATSIALRPGHRIAVPV